MTPEDVYKRWCLEARKRGGNVNVKWFTPQGKKEFLSKPEVHKLAKFNSRIIIAALEAHPKIRDALDHAVATASGQYKKKDSSSLQPLSSAVPQPRASKATPTPKPTRRKAKPTRPILSNNDPYTSAERGHQPRSRPTPTFSNALCPACGLIEDGCPCSR